MSLEASLRAESLKVLSNIDKNRGRSLSPGSGGRGRSINQTTMSRSVSRSKPEEYKWSITSHDPSERLRSPSRLREDTDDDDDDEDDDEDDYEPSDEEIISSDEKDADNKKDEDLYVPPLPNYSIPKDQAGAVKPTISKEARLAIKKDQLDAAHRAIVNAKETRSEVPVEAKKLFEELAEEVGYEKVGSSSYQEADERKNKLQSYAAYKKKLISADSNNEYTNSVEEKMDKEIAQELNSKVVKSDIESDALHQRAVRTLVRGDFFEILKKTKEQPKTFLLCMDFSPESIYALEWAVGTILVDGSVLYIVNVFEDTEFASASLNGDLSKTKNTIATASSSLTLFSPKSTDREGIRKESVEYMTNAVLDKLSLTKLQVHVVIESIHHPIPRHLILEVIDHLTPNLVVVGSKGRSSLKGVLLGSLSNYIVTKSSVPVMVVRSKLKRNAKKKKQFSNNLTIHINQAKID